MPHSRGAAWGRTGVPRPTAVRRRLDSG